MCLGVCGGTTGEGGRRQTKGKFVWVFKSLSVLQSSQIEGLKWRLDGVPGHKEDRAAHTGGREREERKESKERNSETL